VIIAEGICLALAPFSIWMSRGQIRAWWERRKRYAANGYDILAIKRAEAESRQKKFTDQPEENAITSDETV
jgi:hypothetical protein